MARKGWQGSVYQRILVWLRVKAPMIPNAMHSEKTIPARRRPRTWRTSASSGRAKTPSEKPKAPKISRG